MARLPDRAGAIGVVLAAILYFMLPSQAAVEEKDEWVKGTTDLYGMEQGQRPGDSC
jgi:hypothetical protein